MGWNIPQHGKLCMWLRFQMLPDNILTCRVGRSQMSINTSQKISCDSYHPDVTSDMEVGNGWLFRGPKHKIIRGLQHSNSPKPRSSNQSTSLVNSHTVVVLFLRTHSLKKKIFSKHLYLIWLILLINLNYLILENNADLDILESGSHKAI